jgi:RNA 2',3'-cyclic 3'-phosphodiesterase
MKKRLFIAFALSVKDNEKINAQLTIQTCDNIRMIPDCNRHLTLEFLGNVDENLIGKIKEQLKCIANETMPFTLHFKMLLAFPPRAPRVLCLYAKAHDAIRQLVDDIQLMCVEFTIPFKRRAYLPHISLARLKKRHISFAPLSFAYELSCSHLILFESVSSEEGVYYKQLGKYQLNNGGGC